MIEQSSASSAFSEGKTNQEDEPRLGVWGRIALVWFAVTAIWLLIHALANLLFGAEYSRSAHLFRAVLASLLVIPLIVLARRWLDRRPWGLPGLHSLRIGWRPLLIGMICWLIPAIFGIWVCVQSGWTEIKLDVPIVDLLLLAVGLLGLVFIYEALPEELIFRGYFYQNLAGAMPRWLAVVGQALLFVLWGLANGGPNSLDRSVLFFVAGIILGIFRVITGSLWASIGFHLAFQTVAQLFGSIGGQFMISEPQSLTIFAFGLLPFATAVTILKLFYKERPNWLEREC